MPETPQYQGFQQPPGPGLGVVCETRSNETQWSGVAPRAAHPTSAGAFLKGVHGSNSLCFSPQGIPILLSLESCKLCFYSSIY